MFVEIQKQEIMTNYEKQIVLNSIKDRIATIQKYLHTYDIFVNERSDIYGYWYINKNLFNSLEKLNELYFLYLGINYGWAFDISESISTHQRQLRFNLLNSYYGGRLDVFLHQYTENIPNPI